ncbi:MAG: hypothetical protein PHS56_00570 [Eubacteriales bacterium]|nr:hypothetical protein [Eubacteriales bacterium]
MKMPNLKRMMPGNKKGMGTTEATEKVLKGRTSFIEARPFLWYNRGILIQKWMI